MSSLCGLTEGEWLRGAPSEALFARWPARKAAPLWKRLVGVGLARDDTPIAVLECRPDGLTLRNAAGLSVSALSWEVPFVAQLSHWPYEDGSDTAELNLSLRSRGQSGGVVGLRFVWPTSELPAGLPRKRDLSPFASPTLLSRLWPLVSRCAALHGTHLPTGPALEVAPERLARLVSQNEVETCVVCEAQDVEIIAHQVYRCRQCGYEGGQGMPALMRQRRIAAISRMSPQERRQSAQEDLKAVLRSLKFAQLQFVKLEDEDRRGALSVLTDSVEVRRAKKRLSGKRVMAILRHLSDAEHHLEGAGFKLPEALEEHTRFCLERVAPFRVGGPDYITEHRADGIMMLGEVISGVRRAISAMG